MKYINFKKKLLLVLVTILMMQGCKKTHFDNSQIGKPNILRISTRALADGDVKENAIRMLRLVVFDANDGSQLINKQFMTVDAGSSPTPGTYTYFMKNGDDNYEISELLKKNDIQILIIANELSSLSDKTLSLEQVRGSILNFRNAYTVGSRTDIIITADPNATDNRGYIPMYSESEVLSHGLWDASAGKQIRMIMKRCLAKVSVAVKAGVITSPEFVVGFKLEVQSVSIGRMAQFNFLGEIGVDYRAAFTSGSTVNFANPITIISGNHADLITDKLTFYIPEFIISQNLLDNQQYNYLQVNAVYVETSGNQLQTSFRIPIGNGVSKIYQVPSVPIEQLTVKDLSITRNNYYDFEATILSIGKLEVLSVKAKIKDWEKTVEVDGDIGAPNLNISTLDSKMTEEKVRVYFWSNLHDVFIEPQGKKNGVDCQVNDIFVNASDLAGINTSNFNIFQSTNDQHFPFNGYLDLQFKDLAAYVGNSDTYTLTFRAGKLTRTLTVEANPIIGKINFDTNGSGVNSIVKDVKLSAVGLIHSVVGGVVSLADPKDKIGAPPSGKTTFVGWSYTRNGLDLVPTNASMVEVTMVGYLTTVYAAWI